MTRGERIEEEGKKEINRENWERKAKRKSKAPGAEAIEEAKLGEASGGIGG